MEFISDDVNKTDKYRTEKSARRKIDYTNKIVLGDHFTVVARHDEWVEYSGRLLNYEGTYEPKLLHNNHKVAKVFGGWNKLYLKCTDGKVLAVGGESLQVVPAYDTGTRDNLFREVSFGDYPIVDIALNLTSGVFLLENGSAILFSHGTDMGPYPVPIPGKVKKVSIGSYEFIALTEDNEIYRVALFNGDIRKVTGLPIAYPIKDVYCHLDSFFAVSEDGDLLQLWGTDYMGIFKTEHIDRPSVVNGLDGVKQIVAGSFEYYILHTSGKVSRWYNTQEENYERVQALGDFMGPHPVEELKDITYLQSSTTHFGAVSEYGEIYLWGKNEFGALGDGTFADKFKPHKTKLKF